MNWQEHMKQNAKNWLTRNNDDIALDANFLMPFGNPYLFQQESFVSLFSNISQAGVFYRATYKGLSVSYCYPLFGAPAVAMYVEVLSLLGVKNIVGCGYVGGISPSMEIGSYVVPSAACGLDGCSRSYYPYRFIFPSSPSLTNELCSLLKDQGVKYQVGQIVSIDALMLEDDIMIKDFADQMFCCVDLESAILYALGEKFSLNVSSVHIVSDNPSRKLIDEERYHEASFLNQIDLALSALRNH